MRSHELKRRLEGCYKKADQFIVACFYIIGAGAQCVSYQFFLSVDVCVMVFSDYTKQRILSLHWSGHEVSTIAEYLVLEDGIRVSKVGVRRFIQRYTTRGTKARQPGSGFPPRLTPEIQAIIERAIRKDD